MKIPHKPFTMSQFISVNALNISPHDGPSVRLIGNWLRDQGCVRKKRSHAVLWIPPGFDDRAGLKVRLSK